MSDDKLLRMLGSIAAEQRREGEASPHERWSRGELSTAEIAALERSTASNDDERDLLEVARPLDTAARERIVRTLADRLAPTRRPWQWQRRVTVAVSGLALAAALALFVRQTGSGELPAYVLESSGASSSRDGPASTAGRATCALRANTGGSFELLARPSDAVEHEVAAHAFLVRGGDVEPWKGQLRTSPKGTVQLLDETRTLDGASELRVVIGRADRLTLEHARSLARAPDSAPGAVRVLRCAITTE